MGALPPNPRGFNFQCKLKAQNRQIHTFKIITIWTNSLQFFTILSIALLFIYKTIHLARNEGFKFVMATSGSALDNEPLPYDSISQGEATFLCSWALRVVAAAVFQAIIWVPSHCQGFASPLPSLL